jgi:uncharacterized protein (TIGR01244 family)
MKTLLLLALPLALAASTASAATPLGLDRAAAPDTVADVAGFQGRIHREGRVYVAGQPDADALRTLAGRGLVAVVNLRTPAEVADRERVPFDEPALADSLGLAYVPIPLGGSDHPYTPAAVDSFAATLDRYDGPVLLHCTVGWRASHLWAAYLVRHLGLPVDEAYARGEAMGIGVMPFARMIDRPVRVVADTEEP